MSEAVEVIHYAEPENVFIHLDLLCVNATYKNSKYGTNISLFIGEMH